ncbi:MAG: PrsW family glutamic-type intramembrane protease [Syntrophothermus sp.]
MMKLLISALPVLLFLFFLVYMDTFKLIKKSILAAAMLWGAAAAVGSYFVSLLLSGAIKMGPGYYSGIIAPFIEEALKIALIIYLIKRNRLGFAIDGAIAGFASGTGFALIENLFYLNQLPTDNMFLWVVRGFGTAVMHGGTAAVFAIIVLSGNENEKRLGKWLRGFALAAFIHAFYNQFIISPLYSSLLVILILPVLIIYIFDRGERSLRNWMELELDSEIKLMLMIRKGEFAATRPGKYILSIKDRFSKEVTFDMLCYIKLYIELSIKAKSILMLNESGLSVERGNDGAAEKLDELKQLEKNIGRAGIYAIAPVLRMNRKDLWKLNMLS